MTIYRAKWIAPVITPVIEDGAVAVENGRIAAVGRAVDVLRDASCGTEIQDLGDVLVTPGFVNAHAHLDLTCYRGMLPAGPLWPWLAKLIELRRSPGAEDREREGVGKGIEVSLASGVTCIGDISRTVLPADEGAPALIRRVCFLELISGARQRPNDVASLNECLAMMEQLSASPMLTAGISPHSPYTVTAEDYVGAMQIAAKRGMPVTMHYLETREEVEWLRQGRGLVGEFLQRVGSPNGAEDAAVKMASVLGGANAWDVSMLFAHVNYANDDDIRRIAESSASVVWCPRAHRYYGHENHRWREMMAAGINVCVGTDSAACVPSLSILDELREIHRLAPDESPETLIRMGTLNGATALGLADRVGSLDVGKMADFAVIPTKANGKKEALEGLFETGIEPVAAFAAGRLAFGGVAATFNSRESK